tara:strand:- start:30 stop:263 length:234 start_codon:yes stop_codon:yes gene_type:complete
MISIYETGKVVFTASQSSVAVTLKGSYTVIPAVSATVYDSNLDINITIQDITITGFTMLSSDIPGSTMTVNYIVLGE